MKAHEMKIMCIIIEMEQILNLLGTPRNTAGWTAVEVTGQIMDKIGPILATKYLEIN